MTAVRAGRLRHRVSLQERQVSVNAVTGDRTITWTPVAELWADVAPLSGREYIAAAATQTAVTTRITIRFRAGVHHLQRIVYDSAIYNIQAVLPDADSGREHLTLLCTEGSNDG